MFVLDLQILLIHVVTGGCVDQGGLLAESWDLSDVMIDLVIDLAVPSATEPNGLIQIGQLEVAGPMTSRRYFTTTYGTGTEVTCRPSI
jgi:hypothetical protein